MSRICDFPLHYTNKEGEDKLIYVDASDYVKFRSGEKTLREAFGHYVNEEIIEELEEFEKTHSTTYI